jgi:hypothetical protein
MLDPLSLHSKISPSIAHALNLPWVFTGSGQQSCLATPCIPTANGHYRSRVNFMVGFHLPSDVVLGNNWIDSCQPVLVQDRSAIQQPCSTVRDNLSPPHFRYPVEGLLFLICIDIPHSHAIIGPEDLSQKLRVSNAAARDALSSFLAECCTNDIFCVDFLGDHAVVSTCNSHDDRRDAWARFLHQGCRV